MPPSCCVRDDTQVDLAEELAQSANELEVASLSCSCIYDHDDDVKVVIRTRMVRRENSH